MKIMPVIGTRPEAIKLAPVIKELEKYQDDIISLVCVTAQHKELLHPFLESFKIEPDYDLDIMKSNQSLFNLTASILIKLKQILKNENPDIILVQGDTTTAFTASLAGFYSKIKIAHVEAGLRSYDKYNPFPEEMNRKIIDSLSDIHFAPTETAKNNLLREGVKEKTVFVTGNTVVDTLFMILNNGKYGERRIPENINISFKEGNRVILVTAHRRESFGHDFENICRAIKKIAELNDDVEVIYPVHLNPNVQEPVKRILKDNGRIHLINPLDYESFVWLMDKSYLVLTDSGGIQEEAPSLGKPVLVLRRVTERPEAVEAGTVKVIGVDRDKIIRETQRLLDDQTLYEKMSKAANPYGDGKASKKIVEVLRGVE